VNEIGEERDRARQQEDRELREGGQTEDRQADGYCLDTVPRADNRALDEAMGVPEFIRVIVIVRVRVLSHCHDVFSSRPRTEQAEA